MPAYESDLQMIIDLSREANVYLRVYRAKVLSIDDPLKRGRALVQIPALNFGMSLTDSTIADQDSGSWAWPSKMHGVDVPEVDEWVLIVFRDGDTRYPVYIGQCHDIEDTATTEYAGVTARHVLWDSRKTGQKIVVDTDAGTYEVGEATEAFVKGTTFKTELDKLIKMVTDLQTAFNTWVPVPADGGAALKTAAATFIADPLPSSSSILSTTIKGE